MAEWKSTDSVRRAQEFIDNLRPGGAAREPHPPLEDDEAFWFLRAVDDEIVTFRQCDPKCSRVRRWGVAGGHEFLTQSGQLRHLYSNPAENPRLNREYVPHIAAYAKAILGEGYSKEYSSFSKYRAFARDAITRKAGSGYETDAEFYDGNGSIWLHIEAKREGRSVEVIAKQIDSIGELRMLPRQTAKEIEYVLDLAPKYLWLVGPGSVDPAKHVFAVEVQGSTARFTRVACIPPPPSNLPSDSQKHPIGNRIELHEKGDSFARVTEKPIGRETTGPGLSSIDPFAIAIEKLCPECRKSDGSGETAFNFYAPGEAIVFGVFKSGDIWTDLKRLGKERASRLRSALSALDVDLPTDKEWSFWKRGDKKINIAELDPLAVARAIKHALGTQS